MVRISVLLMGLLVLVGCSDGVRLRSDHRSDYDFTAVHSFALMPLEPDTKTLLAVDPLVLDRLRTASLEELLARGYQQAAGDQADVLVSVLVDVQGKVDVIPYGYHHDMYRPWYGHGHGYRGYGGYRTINYEEGTLLIDLIDRQTREVIWRGSARKRLGPEMDAAQQRDLIHRVLAAFPPPRE